MLNQNQIQNKIPSNSIRLQKSNSEANHNNKKLYKESKHYIITKKNKIPREKIIRNNHYLKQKQKFIANIHQHIQSKLSPFCKICGSINYINKETNKLIESIKPHNYYYPPEFSITLMLENLKNKTTLEYRNIFAEFKGKKINSNIISIRNKIINKYIDYSKKILINKNTIYLAIILMDIIILKKNINTKTKIEQISLGCYFLAVKFLDLAVNSFGIKEYQYTQEIAVSYSLEQIRKFEVNCLINVEYNLSIINFITVLQIFLANGILLKKDIKMINSEQSLKNIYFLINKISENLIYEDIHYIQYNQFNMACAILYLSRNISKLEPWPKIFIDLYDIIFDDFSEEYKYINNFCENNILIQNLGNKKRNRNNSTCKNINMKRISFNSTFNNNSNKTLIQNENISNKVICINDNINNNPLNKNIYQYNEKKHKYYNGNNNNNNNNSLVCDTASNFNNFFTNSSQKHYNDSGGKNNSMKKSNYNNSKESLREKKIKLLNSSSKYIRTQHKLSKNNHQIAFNQSMEMPRKTWIFQNKISNSRSKKIDNEKINTNRSQRSEKTNYIYIINKNSNKNVNDNAENDIIYKEDNLFNGKKYSEKKNKFKKILNNSEIQTKKKNNSQSNLLPFNIKKSSSVKIIVDNPKKHNLSNNSNGKQEKLNHNINNNNSTTHKDSKNIKNNINCYYSNVKLKNKDKKKRYLYYNNSNIDLYKNNNNSSIKKDNDISKEYKDIIGNLSFIAITDSYNLNSQKKNISNNENNNKRNNIKIIDNSSKNNKDINNNNNNIQKDIDCYQSKNNGTKNRIYHIKYNSCINQKIVNINLNNEKYLGLKKEINTSHKTKHIKDVNNNILHKNYNTNIILNKQNNNNIVIKINLVNKKFDKINNNNNHLFQRNIKKNNDGIGVIKKIKINNYNIRRKETSKRKRIDSNVSSCHYKNNNSNNNSSLVNQNNRSNGNFNGKNNSDGYKHKISKNYQIKNNRYNIDKRSRNYSMINQKKLKNSNSLL